MALLNIDYPQAQGYRYQTKIVKSVELSGAKPANLYFGIGKN